MSGGTRHSSAVSQGGHCTLGDGQHSDIVVIMNIPAKRAYKSKQSHGNGAYAFRTIKLPRHSLVKTKSSKCTYVR